MRDDFLKSKLNTKIEKQGRLTILSFQSTGC